jgi:hypothetical protein
MKVEVAILVKGDAAALSTVDGLNLSEPISWPVQTGGELHLPEATVIDAIGPALGRGKASLTTVPIDKKGQGLGLDAIVRV